jgi:hypothetical protein
MKSTWIYASISPHVFVAWCLIYRERERERERDENVGGGSERYYSVGEG